MAAARRAVRGTPKKAPAGRRHLMEPPRTREEVAAALRAAVLRAAGRWVPETLGAAPQAQLAPALEAAAPGQPETRAAAGPMPAGRAERARREGKWSPGTLPRPIRAGSARAIAESSKSQA